MNTLNSYIQTLKNHTEIVENNPLEIESENKKVLCDTLSATIFLLIPVLFATLIIEPERYLWLFFVPLIIFSYGTIRYIDKICQRYGATTISYILWTVLYIGSVYVGIISSIDSVGVIPSVFFAVLPLIILDKPKNVLSFSTVLYILTIILIFVCKDSAYIITADTINCTLFFVTGILIGQSVADTSLSKIQVQKELRTREHTDFLTKLPNRRKLFECFAENLKFNGIIMLDIDDFKQYNDTYGHQKGDVVLKALSACLNEMLENNLEFFRYGGEEFIGIYYCNCAEELSEICHVLNEKIRKMQLPHSATHKGYVTASIGYYFSDEPIKSEVAINYADIALYEAKSQGKDCAILYQKTMEEMLFSVSPSFHVKKEG